MSGRVWMSGVLGNYDIGMKQGTRTKFYGHDWNPASLDIPVEPDEVYAASRKHAMGHALNRSEFPEALAVFDEKRFAKVKDIFTAGPFYLVKGRLAEILGKYDLGEGGLIPFDIFESDLQTRLAGNFYILNFGARKNTFLPNLSGDVRKFIVDRNTGIQVWDVNSLNPEAEVVVSNGALSGPDIWFDPAVYNKIFMSEKLSLDLIEMGMADLFKLKECKVLGGGQ